MSDYFDQLAAKRVNGSPSGTGVLPGHGGAAEHEVSAEHDQWVVQSIEASGLFFSEWYLRAYGDVAASGVSPVEHFAFRGWREYRNPNPYFHVAYYLQQLPDNLKDNINPLVHYVRAGEQLGTKPSLIFDPAWYRRRYELPEGVSPLKHYLQNIRLGKFNPIEEFEVEFYLNQYDDVRKAGVDPVLHYFEVGFREGREPSALFDSKFYRIKYLAGSSSENPLLHYLLHKQKDLTLQKIFHSGGVPARDIKIFTRPGKYFEEFRAIEPKTSRRVKLLAYFLPQFHTFPENEEWWGSGFTEWTNIARGTPRFQGHYQPRIPRDLGFYELSDVSVMQRQIAMAKGAGLFGFIFYFYWFDAKRLMQKPLDLFLKHKELDFPFCLMWANENWTRSWDGMNEDILIQQNYSEVHDASLIKEFLQYFRDPRYIRVGGRPLLMIYRPGVIPNAAAVLARLRRLFVEIGKENPILIMALGFGDYDPFKYGLDGAIEFPPHKLADSLPHINNELTLFDPDFEGQVVDYNAVVSASVSEPPPHFPLIKTAFPSWDNDARRQGRGMVVHGSTPASYQAWLEELIAYASHRPFMGESFVCINSWNEWAEGAYLEPDIHFGSAYLNATARAASTVCTSRTSKILLIGHDAHPHGAQLLLLNMAKLMRHRFGLVIEILLLSEGPLLDGYKAIAPTTVVGKPAEMKEALRQLYGRGFRHAIVNSAASSSCAEHIAKAGLTATMLIHELPSVLEEKGLIPPLKAAVRHVSELVFPASFVRDRVLSLLDISPTRVRVMPQGCYKDVPFAAEDRERIRTELGVSSREKLILGVGFADLRKGFDLFLRCWSIAENKGTKLHFLWVGNIEQSIRVYLRDEICAASATGRFHVMGFTDRVAAYYSAADVFLLTSREDPFPTVVIEALQAGVPTVCFAGTGGIPEMVEKFNVGIAVPLGDIEAAFQAIEKLSAQAELEISFREHLAGVARTYFAFPDYVANLLKGRPEGHIKVSVVVPNYNYAHYLKGRLQSIFNQTYPIFEIIVLDDCSSDDSIEQLNEIRKVSGRTFEIATGERNSGSVFRQWKKAANLARGEYVWLAEADDESELQFLERLIAKILSSRDVILAFSDSRAVDETGTDLSKTYKPYYAETCSVLEHDGTFEAKEFLRQCLSERNLLLNVSAVIWRRDALLAGLEAAGDKIFSFKMAGDWALYIHTLSIMKGTVVYDAEPLNIHRRHSASVTHSLQAEAHVKEIADAHKLIRELLGEDIEVLARQTQYLEKVAGQFGVKIESGLKSGKRSKSQGERKPGVVARRRRSEVVGRRQAAES